MLLTICHSAARMLKSNGGSRDDGFACLCSKISNFVASLTAETFYQTGQKVIVLQLCRSLPLTAIDKYLWEQDQYSCLPWTFGCVPLQSIGDQAGQHCSNQCSLVKSPYEGEPDQLSGPCGCIVPHHACSAEFNEGIVKELCAVLGTRDFATALTDSEGSMAAGGTRRLHNSKDLSPLATAE